MCQSHWLGGNFGEIENEQGDWSTEKTEQKRRASEQAIESSVYFMYETEYISELKIEQINQLGYRHVQWAGKMPTMFVWCIVIMSFFFSLFVACTRCTWAVVYARYLKLSNKQPNDDDCGRAQWFECKLKRQHEEQYYNGYGKHKPQKWTIEFEANKEHCLNNEEEGAAQNGIEKKHTHFVNQRKHSSISFILLIARRTRVSFRFVAIFQLWLKIQRQQQISNDSWL